MNEGILSAIGHTPLVRMTRLFKDQPFDFYVKLESFNPGGSMKDRSAATIISQAIASGEVGPDTTVIESSSGNMGVGLAQICTYHGLRFICVVDAKTTTQNIRLLEAYGAEIDVVTEPDPGTGEYLKARLDRVQTLLAVTPQSFWPNQYANCANPYAHQQTMGEIATTLGGKVDYLFCATSTCGTLRGCAEYIREAGLGTTVVAVDAVGSTIFGGHCGKRLIPGHGAAVRPALFQPGLAKRCVHVTDLDCVIGCRRLARQEAILTGGSGGGVISAVESMKESIAPGATCVAILADRGERYLDTIYSDTWVRQHFGSVSYPWRDTSKEQVCVTTTF